MDQVAGRSSDTASESISATPRVTKERTPLPVKQILVIATVLLTEPLTNSIIRSFDGASNVVGPVLHNTSGGGIFSNVYSQFMESSLFLAKAATAYQWGRLSDRLGRRPILLVGPFGLGLSTCILGVTNNAWIQTSARSMQGVFGGNLETTKTVIAEITDASNRHRAYAAIPFVQSLGISIGSYLGNWLATLSERYPFLVNIPFIKAHPRVIPCNIAAAFAFFAFHLTYHGFEETLRPEFKIEWKVLWNMSNRVQIAATSAMPSLTTALLDQARDVGYNTVNRIQNMAENAISSAREEVNQGINAIVQTSAIDERLGLKDMMGRQLIMALANYAFISFLDQAQQTLVPLVYTSPVEQGGLGLSLDEMSKIMARWGSYNTPGQLLLFPWIIQRYGPKKVYATCLTSMVAFFALFPALIVANARLGYSTTLLSTHMMLTSLAYMAYGSAQLLIMEAVNDTRSMGTVNGIAQSVGSSARMLAPPFICIFFDLARNSDGGGVERYSLYVVLVSVAVIGAMMSSWLSAADKLQIVGGVAHMMENALDGSGKASTRSTLPE